MLNEMLAILVNIFKDYFIRFIYFYDFLSGKMKLFFTYNDILITFNLVNNYSIELYFSLQELTFKG